MHKLKTSFLVLSLGLVLTNNSRAELLISWDLPVSSTATSVVASHVATGIQAGSTINANLTSVNSTFNGWGGTGATTASSPDSTGFYFSITPTEGYNVSISGAQNLSLFRQTGGPHYWDFIYSPNSDFTNSRLYLTFVFGGTVALNVTTQLSSYLAANPVVITSGNTGYFRLATYGASGAGEARISNGTSSDVAFTGSITPVPEPSALSLLTVGLGGLAMMRRRRL